MLLTWCGERRPLVGRGWFSCLSLVSGWTKVDIDAVRLDELTSAPWFSQIGTLSDVAVVGRGGDVGKTIISGVGKMRNSGYLQIKEINIPLSVRALGSTSAS